MTLSAALSNATSGLRYTQRALSAAADNVANAQTAGYTRKSVAAVAENSSLAGIGVRTGIVTRDIDEALLTQLNKATGSLAAATVREQILTGVEQAQGQTGQGDSLGDRVGALRSSFIAMRGDPATSSWQSSVLLAAHAVTDRLQAAAGAVQNARQRAQDGIVQEVDSLNRALSDIVSTTQQIREQKSVGLSTANLEDQRDRAIASFSASVPVKAIRADDGGIALITQGGQSISIPTLGVAFATQPSLIGPPSYYGPGGTIPPVTLYGIDVTKQIQGGRLGEYIALRDNTLPRFQAELDITAANLATRLDAQGLRLFADGAGNLPDPTQPYAGGAMMGFAQTMRVNPAVEANSNTLRDGTQAITGSAFGAADFTPNPAGGPADFSTLLDRVLNNSFGAEAQSGTPWASIQTTGIGPDGSLSSPFLAPGTIGDFAAQVTASQTGDRARATSAKEDAQLLSDGLQTRFAERAGVDIDKEMALMVTLQNAYAANARVIGTVQTMWDALLAVVR